SASRPSGRRSRRTAPRPTSPDLERAERIGKFWSYPQSRAFAELLIDCEEDRTLRAAAIDQVSGGRFELGLGAGAFADQEMAGGVYMTPGGRVARPAQA